VQDLLSVRPAIELEGLPVQGMAVSYDRNVARKTVEVGSM
jgi:hypothetical protein